MFLTTVMPAYNVAPFLRRGVESVLAGGIEPCEHEVLIVDDGSSDGTAELADLLASEYEGRVRVVHKANGGVASARNAGIELARGKWLHFMDSDDRLVAGSYKALRDGFMGCPEPDYVGFHSVTLDAIMRKKWRETGDTSGRVVFEGPGTEYYASGRFLCFSVTGLYDTDFLRESGVRFDERMRIAEDTDFMLRFAMTAPRMRLTDAVLYLYEVREGSGTTRRGKEHMRACVESYMRLFATIKAEAEKHAGFGRASGAMKASQAIPFFSRVLSAGLSGEEIRLLRGRLEELGMYPLSGGGRFAAVMNGLLAMPGLCVPAGWLYRNFFVPYVLPRLSRN